MTERGITGAGAVLLAAYFRIDRIKLNKMFMPLFTLFPDIDSATVWSVVKLLHEEEKSVTEITLSLGIETKVIESIKKCMENIREISWEKE